MSAEPWSKFFWTDWESDPGLRLCSLAAQGLWMRMLCVCAKHEPKGYLAINGNTLSIEDVARLTGVSADEAGTLMEELDRHGVFSRDRTGRIYSRRMVRDDKRSKEGRKHKKTALAQASEGKGKKPRPSRGPTRGASPQKPEARREEASCKASSLPQAPAARAQKKARAADAEARHVNGGANCAAEKPPPDSEAKAAAVAYAEEIARNMRAKDGGKRKRSADGRTKLNGAKQEA